MASTSPTPSPATARFLAAIIDHLAHPVFVKDREFRFVIVNAALCQMVGRSQEEFLGKTDYDFFPREEADFFRRKDLEAFASGKAVVIDEEPITDAQGERHVLAHRRRSATDPLAADREIHSRLLRMGRRRGPRRSRIRGGACWRSGRPPCVRR
ncbi:MAG: PAS domain-containing protein [Myxococcaceae bacterium]